MARKVLSSTGSGEPTFGVPRRNWPLKPIRFFPQKSVRRMMVNNPASGLSAPEFKNLLGGVALRTRNVATRFQSPQTPPRSNTGKTTVRPAANRVKRLK